MNTATIDCRILSLSLSLSHSHSLSLSLSLSLTLSLSQTPTTTKTKKILKPTAISFSSPALSSPVLPLVELCAPHCSVTFCSFCFCQFSFFIWALPTLFAHYVCMHTIIQSGSQLNPFEWSIWLRHFQEPILRFINLQLAWLYVCRHNFF
jgi:hypothetical protein